ncbi:MAG TPA: hypothetical protein VMP01_16265 [Pirellulaceae bacterium]|nr:hypothetical protein [Pirellulaceae bacterium]
MPTADSQGGSILLIDEFFAAEEPRFLETLRAFRNPKALAAFADRWKRDPRPWARQRMIEYLQMPLNAPGHQPVIKRLFKHAEQSRDHELLAVFLVIFDRLVRRQRKRRWQYDWQTRQSWEEEILATRQDVIPSDAPQQFRDPRTGARVEVPRRIPKNGRLFRYHTRYYLRRRAWRYYRRLGFQRPKEYVPAIAQALVQYRDEDLSAAEHALECWGLMQAGFHHSDVLRFRADRIVLRSGRKFSELKPAPYFPKLWETPEALATLLKIVTAAQSRLVRVWAIEMVRQKQQPNLASLAVQQLLELLNHENPDVQQFGSELLLLSPSLAKLSIDFWLKLLEVKDPTALAAICDAMRKHVSRERLTLAQCVELACARAAPVARLGFEFVRQSDILSSADRQAIAGLAKARCEATGRELALWALPIVGARENYDRDAVCGFFDSLLAQMRTGAWIWLATSATAQQDAALFSRLVETPYDDLRLKLVDELARKAELPGTADLVPVWSTVLLGVHRGGRQKGKATGQLAAAIAREPQRADELLPVLAASIRSVRQPERRSGLAAVVQLVAECPELAASVSRHLPELYLTREET